MTFDGKIIVPLSSQHVIELAKIEDRTHRERIARVMVDISHGWTLAPEHTLLVAEIQRAIAILLNKLIPPTPLQLEGGCPLLSANLNLYMKNCP